MLFSLNWVVKLKHGEYEVSKMIVVWHCEMSFLLVLSKIDLFLKKEHALMSQWPMMTESVHLSSQNLLDLCGDFKL